MIGVQVWPIREVRGWGGDVDEIDELDHHPQGDLEDALGETYDVDAHAVPYALYDGEELLDEAPRLKKASIPHLAELGFDVRLASLWVDVDCPKELKDDASAIDEWSVDQYAELNDSGLCPAYRYRTKHGYRLIWILDEVVDPETYERIHTTQRAEIRRASEGLIIPDELPDWTRCYRLPAVVRDGERQWFPLEPLADPHVLSVHDLKGARTASVSRFSGLDRVKPKLKVGDEIEEAREVTLFKIGSSMRAQGHPEASILAALHAINEERCRPPLDVGEVEHAADSAGKYEAGDLPKVPKASSSGVEFQLGTEAEVAGWLLEELERDGPRVVFDRSVLWAYEPETGVWDELRPSELTTAIVALDGSWIVGSKKAVPLKIGAAFASNVIKLLGLLRDSPGFFDDAPPGVAFRGGQVVRVSSDGLEVVDASPDHRLRHTLDVEWDPDAKAPTFDRVLERSFRGTSDAEQRADILSEYAGACLLGCATDYQKALLLVGDGANGKSTLLDGISGLFASGARVSIPPQLFGDMYHRAELAGALVNIVTEVPEKDIAASEAFRSIVDGSEIGARHIYQAPFKFRPRAGNLWACNSLPGANDFSHAFWRRWIAVHFPNVIPVAEQEAGLGRRIVTEELAGVARWALEGAVRLAQRGHYSPPGSSTTTLADWRRKADQVALFAEDVVVEDPDSKTQASKVFQEYRHWSKINGYGKLNSRNFGIRFSRLKYRKTREASGVFYLIRLRKRESLWAV